MGKKVTLKQIAELADVSLTTVHRVLNGKGGCSKEVEEKILRIAKEKGYYVSTIAPLQREGPLHVALFFPLRLKGAHFFLSRMLNGYLDYRDEISRFNVVFQEFYVDKPNLSESLEYYIRLLKQIYYEQPVRYDAVILYGLLLSEEVEVWINRIIGKGTKVVVMERCSKGLEDVCRVEVNDVLAGNLAGEMLSKCIHTDGTVVIFNQKFMDGDDINGMTCAECLREYRPNLNIVQVAMDLEMDQSKIIMETMHNYPDVVGAYATCARHTNSLLRALDMTDLKLQAVIGSELFEESYQALQERRLDAVIDKRPELIGYHALRLVFANLVNKEELPISRKVAPRIVMRANSEMCYIAKEEENYYGKDNDFE